MQLGGEKETLEQAQVGALAMTRVSVGVMGPIVDELNVFNLPFVFRDVDHMHEVIDGEIGDAAAAEDHRRSERRAGRPRLDGCRDPQRLQQPASGRRRWRIYRA